MCINVSFINDIKNIDNFSCDVFTFKNHGKINYILSNLHKHYQFPLLILFWHLPFHYARRVMMVPRVDVILIRKLHVY